MSDLDDVAGVLTAIIAVSVIGGGAVAAQGSAHHDGTSTPASTTTSTTNGTGSVSAARCTVGHAMGSAAPVRLNGATVGWLTQYYGICGGQPRNWATLRFDDNALDIYSTQASAAIVRRDTGATVGLARAEESDGVVSNPVATTAVCTAATATVTLVRSSDGRRFGPVTVTTTPRCAR